MQSVPRWPRWLGLLGLVPQIACTLIAFLAPAAWRTPAQDCAAIYATLIFTFLGGTWWGIAAAAPAAERRGGLAWAWIAAIVPSLIAAGGLVAHTFDWLPIEALLVMLGASLLMALGVDARLAALTPRWWLHLRAPLSIGLGGLTLAIAFA
ncbi:DUF3429 domain-containing protein [Qipengyuania flava]|nr:DUF3429 domain-containing protein [Qipengyuania flava]